MRPLSIWLQVHPTPTLTVTLEPLIVAFSPHDESVLFTNQEGIPIASQVVLTPGVQSAVPAVLYVQRAPLVTDAVTSSLAVKVYEPGTGSNDELVLDAPERLVMALESPCKSRWRRFLDLLLGPTTQLLVLVGGAVAFAVEEWRLGRERGQKRKEERLAQVVGLKGLSNDIVQAARRYKEYREKTEKERGWRDPDLRERLDDTWRDLFTRHNLQDGATRQLAQGNFGAARMLAELALEHDFEKPLSQALLTMSELGRLQAERSDREESDPVVKRLGGIDGVEATVRACITVDREYADHGEIEGVRKTVVEQLVALIRRGCLQVVAQELSTYAHAQDLLGEPEFKNPLEERKTEVAAQQMFKLRWEAFRWPGLWPAAPPAVEQPIASWLQTVGLNFNPFGPEAAELDPRLKDYGVEAVFERARGRRPVVVFGPPGSGKTAAALLLDWYCKYPDPPREAGAFPVYYVPPTDVPRDAARRAHLAAAVQTTADAMMRYLARWREGFLKLPPPGKQSVARLLSLCACSDKHLEAGLQRVGPEWGTSRRLIREVTALYQEVSHEGMTEQEYLDLLAGAKPDGFEYLYLLADLPSAMVGPRAPATAHSLRPLLDLIVPLAARGVYLKLFLPDVLRRYLDDLTAYEVMSLTWSADDLTKMLEARFRRAGGDGLGALCVPPDPDIDRQLAKAAGGSPRQLVRVGNALLKEHVRRTSGEPGLSVEWVVSFLQEWGENDG
jgi:hypothetical protein